MEDQKRRDEAEEYRKEEHKRRLEQKLIAERERIMSNDWSEER